MPGSSPGMTVEEAPMKFFSFWRSQASFRVRIALNLKKLPSEVIFVDLDADAHRADEFRRLNPQMALPALIDADGTTLVQSLAIIEYLEETHPAPPLLPKDAVGRGRVRAIAQTIACEIHPLDNLRVLRYLELQLGVDAEARKAWYRHWVELGFAAIERMLVEGAGTGHFCHGDSPTLADCCLVPQLFNAERFGVPLDAYPTILRIGEACCSLAPFQRAAPQAQPDA